MSGEKGRDASLTIPFVVVAIAVTQPIDWVTYVLTDWPYLQLPIIVGLEGHLLREFVVGFVVDSVGGWIDIRGEEVMGDGCDNHHRSAVQ